MSDMAIGFIAGMCLTAAFISTFILPEINAEKSRRESLEAQIGATEKKVDALYREITTLLVDRERLSFEDEIKKILGEAAEKAAKQ